MPSFQVLGGRAATALETLPEAGGRHGGHEVEDAEADAQAPDGLDFETTRLVWVGPFKVVFAGEVHEERVDKVGRVAAIRKVSAGEVADGAAYHTCDNNGGDETETIRARGDEKREHGVPVQDIRDDGIHSRDTSLFRNEIRHHSISSQILEQAHEPSAAVDCLSLTTTRVPTRADGGS